MIANAYPPPQDARVALTHAASTVGSEMAAANPTDKDSLHASSDVGRYAVAARDIAPGDAALIAAPYLFVFNPSEFCSGLYLAARAVPAEEFRRTVAGGSGSGSGGGNGNSHAAAAGDRRARKKTATGDTLSSASAGTPTPPVEGGAPQSSANGTASSGGSFVISHSTRCSECFCEISPGTVLANCAAIKEVAIDISAEQEEVQEFIEEQQRLSGQTVDGAAKDGSEDAESGDGRGKKQKKPARAGKMKSDAALERKMRMYELAVAQRQSIIYERCQRRRQQRQLQQQENHRETPFGLPSCWAGADGATKVTQASTTGFAVCEGCGMIPYCSPRCWSEGHARHVRSGECSTLRWVYPLMMREYYSISAKANGTSGGGGSGAGGGGKQKQAKKDKKSAAGITDAPDPTSVVMPGEEPLHWARNTSEEKNLEAQCMLLLSLLLADCGRTAVPPSSSNKEAVSATDEACFGPAAHWGRTLSRAEEAEAARRQAHEAANRQKRIDADAQAAASERAAEEMEAKDPLAATPPPQRLSPSPQTAAPAAAAERLVLSESQVVPKEVLSMQDSRVRLGLAGKVEVMDADAAKLGDAAETSKAEGLSHHILFRPQDDAAVMADPMHCLYIASSLDDADEGGLYADDAQRSPEAPSAHAEEGAVASHGFHPAAHVPTTHRPQCVRLPCYADQAAMVTNLCVLSKERRGCYGRYYRRFIKVFLPWLLAVTEVQHEQRKRRATAAVGQQQMPHTEETLHLFPPGSCGERYLMWHALKMHSFFREHAAPHQPISLSSPSTDRTPPSMEDVVTEGYFLRVCAAMQCNTFGVYTPEDRQIAFGAYPEASYFNHSCLPNLCRVMGKGGRTAVFYALRPIVKGEALTICYTDVEETNTAERRRNLLETYRFFCVCARCSGVGSEAGGATPPPPPPPPAAEGHASGTPAEKETTDDGIDYNTTVKMVKGCPVYLCSTCPIRGYLRPLAPAEYVNANPPKRWGWESVKERQCTMCGSHYPFQKE